MNVILSFDDGRSDAYEAYKILKQYNLVASFHITTGFIDGTYVTDQFGIGRKPITIEQLQEMHNNGMDISSHGDRHVLNKNDFKNSIKKLNDWGITKNKYGFSVPNSYYTDNSLNEFINKNDCLLYVRAGRNPICYRFLPKICYVLFRFTRLQLFYNYFNKFNINDIVDNNRIYTIVIKKTISHKNVIRFLKKYSNTTFTVVLLFHSIVNQPNNKWEWSINSFTQLSDYLQNTDKKIKILTLEDICKTH